eukprot:TRINITY_DN26091_c0_g1_i1.p4 TRINITY_DN26091_c0_g1~~TRINITY_DN26091_c0_g1_i1.p4  ORF type:complete len:128 (+),score=27.01 TRINITY_DN26091_c0_g1_i1:326-709(+)
MEPVVEAMRAAALPAPFRVRLTAAGVLSNDEADTAFLCLLCDEGSQERLVRLIAAADAAVGDVGGEPYWKDPHPHVSVATSDDPAAIQLCSQKKGPAAVGTLKEPLEFPVSAVVFTFGNRTAKFELI